MFKAVWNLCLVLTSKAVSIPAGTQASCLSTCLEGNRTTEVEHFLTSKSHSHSSQPICFNVLLKKIRVIVSCFMSVWKWSGKIAVSFIKKPKRGEKNKSRPRTRPVGALFSSYFSISSPCFCKLWRGMLGYNSNICFAFTVTCVGNEKQLYFVSLKYN